MYDDVDVENSVSRMGSDYLQEKQDVSCPRGHLINSWTSSSSPMMMMRILMGWCITILMIIKLDERSTACCICSQSGFTID